MSRIPSSKLPSCCVQKQSCCPPEMGGQAGASRIPAPGSSRIPAPGASRIPSAGVSRIPSGGAGRIPVPGSRQIQAPTASRQIPVPAAGRIPAPTAGRIPAPSARGIPAPTGRGIPIPGSRLAQPAAGRPPAEKSISATSGASRLVKPGFKSKLQRFDKAVSEELSRRRDPANVLVEATTSDAALLDAVDRLARAEAAHTFPGAVRAAELAAAAADPARAEEAAAEGARSFQAELIHVVQEDVPGLKPVQVLGYVGITRPKHAAR